MLVEMQRELWYLFIFDFMDHVWPFQDVFYI